MNFLKGLAGIITRPGKTLGTFMEQQKWGATLVLLLVAVFIFTYIMVPSQMAKLSRMVEMSEEYMPFFQTDSVFPRLMTGAMAALMVFISISVGAFFVYLFYGIGGSEGTYSNFFALVVNASVIDTLFPGFLRMLFSLGWFPLPGALSLAHLLPGLESKSFTFLALSRIELFSLWYIAAIGGRLCQNEFQKKPVYRDDLFPLQSRHRFDFRLPIYTNLQNFLTSSPLLFFFFPSLLSFSASQLLSFSASFISPVYRWLPCF
jgi:hypothetical protein